MSILTGVIIAAQFKDSTQRHWSWATSLIVMVLIALIVKDYLTTIEKYNITEYKNQVLQEKLGMKKGQIK